jgi:hypothetical protein
MQFAITKNMDQHFPKARFIYQTNATKTVAATLIFLNYAI